MPRSELVLLLLLAVVQFTHIMDFMIMMPLGPQLKRELGLDSMAFGQLISVFSLTAGTVGFLAAPFLDRFDRRKLLLVVYAGFALSTLACGLTHHLPTLMMARAACGAFGGVAGATLMAIVADLVPPERRARSMSIIMTSFSAAAALGVPFGLKLAQWWKWEAPFLVTASAAGLVWVLLFFKLPCIRGHLDGIEERVSVREGSFVSLLRSRNAWLGIVLMTMLIFGHFTVVPFLSPFLVGNVGFPEEHLFLVYFVGGVVTIFTGLGIGQLADRFGKMRIYVVLTLGASVVIYWLTHAQPMTLLGVMLLAAAFFGIASGRFIPVQATVSLAVPSRQRGAYMSLVSCSRDFAMGLASWLGAKVVADTATGELLHYDRLGLITIVVSLLSLVVFARVKSVE